MRRTSSMLAAALFLAAAAAGQDTSPPCIKSCYDTLPGPQRCEGVEEMTEEILTRCTCSSFVEQPPLYECIRECPKSEQATYLAGFSDQTYSCQEEYFSDITVPSATTTTRPTESSDPTNNADDDDDDNQGTTTSGGGDPAEPNGAGEAFHRAASTLLAAGGLVVALLFSKVESSRAFLGIHSRAW
ncbi:uncharacterized protein B0H64DRAFT_376566 [Chaetomium fimeti]|uniref:Extracellular membrane protein CFEM domain-containing protein n=1 Tax=Chaetomium fimeti TaxID=1854472 RepID=A0AAE0HBW6_9PEZI|nr:hypothetical protein B0H64DRAFT_376566 [Chaetomium fimeti]